MGQKQASCIIPCPHVAICKQISQAEDLSLSESPLAWHLSLVPSRAGFSSCAIAGPPRCTWVLPAALPWTVGHSVRGKVTGLLTKRKAKTDRIWIFLERHQHGVTSVLFPNFSGDYGHYPFLLPEDNSSTWLPAQLKQTAQTEPMLRGVQAWEPQCTDF